GERAWAQDVADRTAELVARPGEAALARAWLHLSRRHLDAAVRVLTPVVNGSEAFETRFARVTALLLSANLHRRRGAVTRAHALLVDALDLAEPWDLLRPFIDGRAETRRHLIEHAGRFGRLETFATRAAALRPSR